MAFHHITAQNERYQNHCLITVCRKKSVGAIMIVMVICVLGGVLDSFANHIAVVLKPRLGFSCLCALVFQK